MLRDISENSVERPYTKRRMTRNRDMMFTLLISRQAYMASCLSRDDVTITPQKTR